MSDEDEVDFDIEGLIEQATQSSYTLQEARSLEDFHFRELVDLRSYVISQEHMVNDLSFKLNNRKGKLNKRLKKGTLYGVG